MRVWVGVGGSDCGGEEGREGGHPYDGASRAGGSESPAPFALLVENEC